MNSTPKFLEKIELTDLASNESVDDRIFNPGKQTRVLEAAAFAYHAMHNSILVNTVRALQTGFHERSSAVSMAGADSPSCLAWKEARYTLCKTAAIYEYYSLL